MFKDLVNDPTSLSGKSAEEVAAGLGEGSTKGISGISGTGRKSTRGVKVLFYHEGGRHVGPYDGIASGLIGKLKVVGPDDRPLPADKARIVFVDG